MKRLLMLCLVLPAASLAAWAQTTAAPNFALSQQSASNQAIASLTPLNDAATVDQIHEYLHLSGDLEAYRSRWMAAVDKNRSIGAPYWPESFWTAIKDEMRNTDLMPLCVAVFQHSVSKELMQQVIDAYHRLGKEHFRGSPECFKLGEATSKTAGDMDSITLAMTQQTVLKVYAVYKPQIKAARTRWMAEHPGWTDK